MGFLQADFAANQDRLYKRIEGTRYWHNVYSLGFAGYIAFPEFWGLKRQGGLEREREDETSKKESSWIPSLP